MAAAENIEDKKELSWETTFPGIPGWYWVYQALPKGNGESFVPVWIESAQSLPLHASAFYGPIEAHEMPDTMKPLEYQKKEADEPENTEGQ